MKNLLIPPYFVIKDGIHGLGVFMTQDIKKGDVLFYMSGEILATPTRTSVQVGKNKHIEDFIAGHINHSCSPNAVINQEKMAFVATNDISEGEEISFDYSENEDKLACPFECECCGKLIQGKKVAVTSGV